MNTDRIRQRKVARGVMRRGFFALRGLEPVGTPVSNSPAWSFVRHKELGCGSPSDDKGVGDELVNLLSHAGSPSTLHSYGFTRRTLETGRTSSAGAAASMRMAPAIMHLYLDYSAVEASQQIQFIL